MGPLIFRRPFWTIGFILTGVIAPWAVIPWIERFGGPAIPGWIHVGAAVFTAAYAATLLQTKLLLSAHGQRQERLYSEFRLPQSEIADWHSVSDSVVERLLIRARNGNEHELKKCLVSGKHRAVELAEFLRKTGAPDYVKFHK